MSANWPKLEKGALMWVIGRSRYGRRFRTRLAIVSSLQGRPREGSNRSRTSHLAPWAASCSWGLPDIPDLMDSSYKQLESLQKLLRTGKRQPRVGDRAGRLEHPGEIINPWSIDRRIYPYLDPSCSAGSRWIHQFCMAETLFKAIRLVSHHGLSP